MFCGGRPSQTFRLPFSGWLALAILPIFTGASHPPRVFILAHLSLGKRRVIPGEGRTFFLFFFLFFSPLRRSQVLTKNLARWTDLNETRDRLESVHPRNSNGGDGEGRIKGFPSLEGREVRKILLRLSSFNNSCRIH